MGKRFGVSDTRVSPCGFGENVLQEQHVGRFYKSTSREFNIHGNIAENRRVYVEVFLDKEDV